MTEDHRVRNNWTPMSWEAVTWANKQKLKKSYEQIVLLVLANCADPNGEAFVKWPGRDHWWIYLSERRGCRSRACSAISTRWWRWGSASARCRCWPTVAPADVQAQHGRTFDIDLARG
jgi:hypothetical protein